MEFKNLNRNLNCVERCMKRKVIVNDKNKFTMDDFLRSKVNHLSQFNYVVHYKIKILIFINSLVVCNI